MQKREFVVMNCPKCKIYLADCLVGTKVMCPKCNEWQDVEKKKRKAGENK